MTMYCAPADKSLLAEGTAVLGLILQFAVRFLPFQGNHCDTLSKVLLRTA